MTRSPQEEPSVSVRVGLAISKNDGSGRREQLRWKKKVNGRKCQFWVDTNGFLLRVLVHAADISDTEGAEWRCVDPAETLLSEHHHCFPRMEEIRVDKGYKAGFERWLAQHTPIKLSIIEKPPEQKGFVVIPKLWVAERSVAWAAR